MAPLVGSMLVAPRVWGVEKGGREDDYPLLWSALAGSKAKGLRYERGCPSVITFLGKGAKVNKNVVF